MKKIIVLLCALMMIAGCSSNQGNNTELSPATYTGVGRGRNGDIQVETVFLGEEIQSVKVLEHTESAIISDPALETIPNAIVENQTLNVDVASGATLTTNGVIKAVEDCITQAGLSVENYQKPVEKNHTEEELTTDVLVVGAGGAGLSAALEAANNGADVLLIEKLSSVGGSAELCLGIIISGAEEGNAESYMTAYDHVQQIKNYNGGNEAQNSEMMDDYAAHIVENAEWVVSNGFNGVYMPWNAAGTMTPNDESGLIPQGWVLSSGVLEFGQGACFTDALEKAAEKAGVNILVNTAGTELLVDENGAVIGAKAYNPVTDTEYTIKANAVVLASGGFGANAEMMAEYNEICTYENGLGIYMGAAGNTADGIKMAEAVGAKTGMFFTDGGIPGDNTVYATTGGVYINGNAQVLDVDGNPIENLYSAGEMTDIALMGSLYTICGTYNGWSIYTGRIAGAQAALED